MNQVAEGSCARVAAPSGRAALATNRITPSPPSPPRRSARRRTRSAVSSRTPARSSRSTKSLRVPWPLVTARRPAGAATGSTVEEAPLVLMCRAYGAAVPAPRAVQPDLDRRERVGLVGQRRAVGPAGELDHLEGTHQPAGVRPTAADRIG